MVPAADWGCSPQVLLSDTRILVSEGPPSIRES